MKFWHKNKFKLYNTWIQINYEYKYCQQKAKRDSKCNKKHTNKVQKALEIIAHHAFINIHISWFGVIIKQNA